MSLLTFRLLVAFQLLAMNFLYLGNGGVSQDVIRGGWLLNPQRLKLCQL